MDTIVYARSVVIPAAFQLLPDKMNSPEATALLLAIGLQESRFIFRHQQQGPAGGFWQFEDAGVHGVLNHPSCRQVAADVLKTMRYNGQTNVIQDALDNNDILAAVLARLLLWTHPNALPLRSQPIKAWMYYISSWRPGKPHQETWEGLYEEAWSLVEGA